MNPIWTVHYPSYNLFKVGQKKISDEKVRRVRKSWFFQFSIKSLKNAKSWFSKILNSFVRRAMSACEPNTDSTRLKLCFDQISAKNFFRRKNSKSSKILIFQVFREIFHMLKTVEKKYNRLKLFHMKIVLHQNFVGTSLWAVFTCIWISEIYLVGKITMRKNVFLPYDPHSWDSIPRPKNTFFSFWNLNASKYSA